MTEADICYFPNTYVLALGMNYPKTTRPSLFFIQIGDCLVESSQNV